MHTHLVSTETVPQLHHVYLVHIAVTTLQPRPSFYRACNFFFSFREVHRRPAGAVHPAHAPKPPSFFTRARGAPAHRRRRACRRDQVFTAHPTFFLFSKPAPAARARGAPPPHRRRASRATACATKFLPRMHQNPFGRSGRGTWRRRAGLIAQMRIYNTNLNKSDQIWFSS